MHMYLRRILAAAESIGTLNRMEMGKWIPGKERIFASGTTDDGKKFEIELVVEKEEEKDA